MNASKDITALYRTFRKENCNRKPDRAIVRMHWEDEPENSLVDTIAFIPAKNIGWSEKYPADDAVLLYYVSSLKGLLELTKPDNGSDFIVEEVLEFYKH